jgi:uncharacterized delta-60 repeat protein
MRPFPRRLDAPTRAPRPGPPTKMLRALLRLLPAAGLLACQLALAGPAQAQAGTLDPTFGTGGKVTTDFTGSFDEANALVMQGSKLVAAGSAGIPAGFATTFDFGLARYNPDGTLDTSFGSGGKVTTDFFGDTDQANALAVQGNKLVAAGAAFTGGGSNPDFALARYNPDGSLDPTFGSGGKVTTDFAASEDQATALVVQADGKLVAAGFTMREFGTISDFALARYNPDGSLDPTFGSGGKVTTDFAASFDRAYGLIVQGDGKLVAAGSVGLGVESEFALARYNPDGSLDATFGSGGKVTTDFAPAGGQATALVVQGGKLVAAGFTISSTDFALARYNPDGTLDTSFGSGGKVTTDFAASTDQAKALAVQGNKLVAAGSTTVGASFDFALARYNPDGTLDAGFGSGGKVTTDFAANFDQVNALVVQGGKLAAAGTATTDPIFSDFGLARYLGH